MKSKTTEKRELQITLAELAKAFDINEEIIKLEHTVKYFSAGMSGMISDEHRVFNETPIEERTIITLTLKDRISENNHDNI